MDEAEELVSAYADWMRSWGASQATIDVRVGKIAPLLREWGGVDGITSERIRAWLIDPRTRKPKDGRPPTAATRSTYHAHMKSFCDWLFAGGLIEVHPMTTDQVRTPKRPDYVPRPITEAQASRALAEATGDLRAWLVLAMRAGLRAHEIAKIKAEDVSEDGIFVRGKGGVEAVLPCHPEILDLAAVYPLRGYWFPDSHAPDGHVPRERISKLVGDYFRRINIPQGSIHRARHYYATSLLRAGVNIRIVQRLMRHSNVKTTAGYTAVDEDELRAAVLKLTA